jgi:hypothetical protein
MPILLWFYTSVTLVWLHYRRIHAEVVPVWINVYDVSEITSVSVEHLLCGTGTQAILTEIFVHFLSPSTEMLE